MIADIVVVSGFPAIPSENRLGLFFPGKQTVLIILHDSFRAPMVWVDPDEMSLRRVTETSKEAEIPNDLYRKILDYYRLEKELSDLSGEYHKFRKELIEEQKGLPQFNS